MRVWNDINRVMLTWVLGLSLMNQIGMAPLLMAQDDPVVCSENAVYADRVIEYIPGSRTNRDFDNPRDALGEPDLSVDPLGGFVHLGIRGTITVEFVDNVILNGEGNDITIWGDPFNDELYEVEVSQDGETFLSFGLVEETAEIDLSDLEENEMEFVQFIRITDDSSTEQVPTNMLLPGPELDAIEALHCEPREAPDADGDGVFDDDDLCPNFSGKPETDGC